MRLVFSMLEKNIVILYRSILLSQIAYKLSICENCNPDHAEMSVQFIVDERNQ